MSRMRDSTRGSELHAHTDLRGRGYAAGAQGGQVQEVSRASIARRVLEVCPIRDVEHVDEDIEASSRARNQPVPEPEIGLEETGAGCAVTAAIEVDVEWVLARTD